MEWKAYLEKTLEVVVVCTTCKDDGKSRLELFDSLLKVELGSGEESRSLEELIGMDASGCIAYREERNRSRKKLSKKVRVRLEQEKKETDEGDSASEDSSDTESESDEGDAPTKRPVVLSILGEPNVGKSSVINYILGTKKVSVSSHPGRTKHLQTHYVCPLLIICDCPGLVFPKRGVPFPMQVLYGCFPIARCRDVYTVVAFLSGRICPELPQILELKQGGEWSVLSICEGFAERKKWTTHKGGRADIYRAANYILRSALAGRDGVILSYCVPEAV